MSTTHEATTPGPEPTKDELQNLFPGAIIPPTRQTKHRELLEQINAHHNGGAQVAHDHATRVPGCFRCDLSADEVTYADVLAADAMDRAAPSSTTPAALTEAERIELAVILGGCTFTENVNDYSMCRCGLPALGHDEAVAQIVVRDHPEMLAFLERILAARALVSEPDGLAERVE
ncbi:hypothetical protein EFK50_16545, partial [Nocardioides marmoriginsengisoli]